MMYINEDRGTIMVLIIKVNSLLACDRRSWVQVFGYQISFHSQEIVASITWWMNFDWSFRAAIERQYHKPHTRHKKNNRKFNIWCDSPVIFDLIRARFEQANIKIANKSCDETNWLCATNVQTCAMWWFDWLSISMRSDHETVTQCLNHFNSIHPFLLRPALHCSSFLISLSNI